MAGFIAVIIMRNCNETFTVKRYIFVLDRTLNVYFPTSQVTDGEET